MALRTENEQRLYMEVLRTTALPRAGNDNHINWLSIDLWNAVTDEYNRRAPRCGVAERTMSSLIQLGKKLRFCSCMPGQVNQIFNMSFLVIDWNLEKYMNTNNSNYLLITIYSLIFSDMPLHNS